MLSKTREAPIVAAAAESGHWGAGQVQCLHDLEQLNQWVEAWGKLAEEAAEPNPFYEPWMLLPALRLLREEAQVGVLLVSHANTAGKRRLIGVLPIEQVRWSHHMPMAAIRSWRYRHCFLATPLIAADAVREFWHLLYKWAEENTAAGMLELPHTAIDGRVHWHLVEHCSERGAPLFVQGQFARAVSRLPEENGALSHDTHLCNTRKKYARRRRKLAEEGRVKVERLEASGKALDGLQTFMRIEAAGWKGRSGTALACDATDQAFFREICDAAHARERLSLLRLEVDGNPIACEIDIHAGDGVFSLKTAYDERYAKYSPGMLLAIEANHILQEHSDVRWIDACATSGADPIKCIWPERRLLGTVQCPLQHRAARLMTSALPLGHQVLECIRGIFSHREASQRH